MSTPGTILLTSAGRVMVRSGKPLAVGPTEAKDCCCTADPCCVDGNLGYYPGGSHRILSSSSFSGTQTISGWKTNITSTPLPTTTATLLLESTRDTTPAPLTCPAENTQASIVLVDGTIPSWAFVGSPSGVSDAGTSSFGYSEGIADPPSFVSGLVLSNGAYVFLDHYPYVQTYGTSYGTLVQQDSGFDTTQVLFWVQISFPQVDYYVRDSGANSFSIGPGLLLTLLIDVAGRLSYYVFVQTLGGTPSGTPTGSASISLTFDGAVITSVVATLTASGALTTPDGGSSVSGTYEFISNMKGCPA